MEHQERHLKAVSSKEGNIKTYENHESNKFATDEEIIGLDANVLIDIVNSKEFKEDLRAEVTFNVLKIYTTEIALGEARNVLIKKKDYNFNDATNRLKDIMEEFKIEKIIHTKEGDDLAEEWIKKVKRKIFIKKFSTFPNDLKIVSNLYLQKEINVYYTEDKDIENAVKVLGIPLVIRILPEATDLSLKKTSKFFRKNNKAPYRKYKRR